jgi:hypothetical protein
VAHHFKPVHVRELKVTDGQMMAAAVKELYGLGARSSRVHRVSLFGKILFQRIRHHWLVINYQNACVFTFHLVFAPLKRLIHLLIEYVQMNRESTIPLFYREAHAQSVSFVARFSAMRFYDPRGKRHSQRVAARVRV